MTDYINLLFLSFLNKLEFFSKLTKNSITLALSNIFLFRANYVISKSATQIFLILWI